MRKNMPHLTVFPPWPWTKPRPVGEIIMRYRLSKTHQGRIPKTAIHHRCCQSNLLAHVQYLNFYEGPKSPYNLLMMGTLNLWNVHYKFSYKKCKEKAEWQSIEKRVFWVKSYFMWKWTHSCESWLCLPSLSLKLWLALPCSPASDASWFPWRRLRRAWKPVRHSMGSSATGWDIDILGLFFHF